MVEEEFAENFDDFPEDFDDEVAPPVQAQAASRGRPSKSQPQPQPQARQQAQARPQPQPQRVQASASAPIQTPDKPRFVPFVLPARNGMFDNQTGQPFMEDQDKLDLIIGILTDHSNRLDRIEQGL